MTQVRTDPYYPQSNGKHERWNQSLKVTIIRPATPTSRDDAGRLVTAFVTHHNDARLHNAIGYITPQIAWPGALNKCGPRVMRGSKRHGPHDSSRIGPPLNRTAAPHHVPTCDIYAEPAHIKVKSTLKERPKFLTASHIDP